MHRLAPSELADWQKAWEKGRAVGTLIAHGLVRVIELAKGDGAAGDLDDAPLEEPAEAFRAPPGPRGLTVDSHLWRPWGQGWFCFVCRRVASNLRALAALQAKPCVPLVADPCRPWGARTHPSHALRVTETGACWCGRCGSFADTVPRGLAGPCHPPSKSGLAALSRLRRGLHPGKALLVGAWRSL